MQSQKLWLSSTNGMNDSQEITWTLHLIQDILRRQETTKNKEKLSYFWVNVSANTIYPFICCFSKNGDLLSQWRAYADDGHGVAIGFERDELNIKNEIPRRGFFVEPALGIMDVIYDKEAQEQFLSQLIEKYEITQIDNALYAARLSPIFKNPAFKEEDEVRIIHNPLLITNKTKNEYDVVANCGKMTHRISSKKLTSYFELDFNPSQVKEIILGPKCQIQFTELKQFLATNNFPTTEIKYSSASYR